MAPGRQLFAVDAAWTKLYCWNSERGGVTGVGVLDLASGNVGDFRRVPLRRGGVTALPPSPRFPEGAVIVYGDSGNIDFSHAVMFVLAGTPLAVQDSIVLAPPSRRFVQVEVIGDGRELLVGTNAELLRIDIATKAILGKSSRPNGGLLQRSPVDGRFFIVAPGTTELPTPNLIHVLWPTFELLGVVDLRSLPQKSQPLGIGGSVVSNDGRWLYVVTGVGREGPVYGPQPTSILVLDTATLSVMDLLELDTFGVGRPQLIQ